MTDCYRFEQIKYKDGLLSNCVDATYIIHLEGNGRIDNIRKQLEEYHPTTTAYIVFNKGYKKCEKPQHVKNSALDLVDANLEIYKHAEQQRYGNILVLEDDFIFSEKIKEIKHRNNICEFLKKKQNEPVCYCIGAIPWLIYPVDYYNYSGVMADMHATIVNNHTRKNALSVNPARIDDWDNDYTLSKCRKKYCYYTCLCYQLHTETENSKNWGHNYKIVTNITTPIILFLFKLLKLDKQPEPGFSVIYLFSKLISFILFVTLLFAFYKLGKFVFGKRVTKRK